MRITEGMRYQSLLQDVGRAQERVLRAQQQVTSGKRVNAPSDDPAAASDILRLNGETSEAQQYLKNLSFAQSKLDVLDSTLDSAQNLAESARLLGLSSLGALNPSSNVAAINSLRDQLVTVANTTHAGRFLFGGSMTTTTPYVKNPDSSVTYQGNDQDMPMQINRSTSVETQVAGSEVFSGSVNVFDVMSALATAMQAGDKPGIDAQVKKLEQYADVLNVARTRVGGAMNLVTNVKSSHTSAQLGRDSELSREEAADLATAISELTISQNGLQATLAAGGRISQLTILDFLK